MLTKEEISGLVKEYGQNEQDTGAIEVQVAILTHDINKLQGHFADNRRDKHSRRGLLRKVSLRRKLLKYLSNNSQERYESLIKRLKLRR